MKKQLLLFLICVLLTVNLTGQDLKKRHSFARSYFGLDLSLLPSPGQSVYLNQEGAPTSFDLAPALVPGINIGGTHFWGHADFYISITTSPIQLADSPVFQQYRLGVFTGLRVYPWQLKTGKLRPFVGYKFSPIRYFQQNLQEDNYLQTNVRSTVDVGLAYQTSSLYLYAGYNRIFNPNLDIYLSRSQRGSSRYPNQLFTIGANILLETTSGAYTKTIARLDSILSNSSQFGLFFGIGPSSAFPTQSSSYIQEELPFLDDRSMPGIFPEITLGYHFSQPDIVLSTAYRPIQQVRSAFGYDQRLFRHSLSLEAYKFLFDYHGFAPFLGVGASQEWVRLEEESMQGNIFANESSYQFIRPTIIFGWDIRPSRKADIWLLRTNLRYTPGLEVDVLDKKLSLEYLEFNFIQFVIYPQRIKKYRSMLD